MQTSSSSSPPRFLGSAIVAELQRRGTTSVPFLARLLGRRPADLEDYLAALADEGVIRRDQDGHDGQDRVSLVSE